MKTSVLILLLFLINSITYSQNGNYYLYNSNKVQLAIDSSVFYFKVVEASSSVRTKITSAINIKDSKLYQITDSEFVIKSTKEINKAFLKSQAVNLKYNSPLFHNSTGSIITIMPQIIVQLKNNHSIKEILSLYNGILRLSKSRGFDTYVLNCDVKSSEELLKISNFLYEKSGIVNWSEPEFFSNFKVDTDPLYGNQYYLKNNSQYGGVSGIDINVEPAWSISKGSSTLRVAVIDEGVEDHEDFSGRVLSGFTAGNTSGIGLPQNGVKGHGVACAGIIAATQDNNIGIKGIAPNVQILPINIFPNAENPPFNPSGVGTNQQIAAAIDWAWNQGHADVLSCSWGGGAQSNDIDAAIGRARTMGRIINGVAKGCPVVFSSGNSNPFQNVSYPGNVNGVITVGACNNAAPSGDIWYYSDRGASMDLVAPSGDVNLNGDVTTTDRMGANGYESGNYTTRFGGTSAACPQVSGVVALMLSVNPNLTESQVHSILETTATDMGATGFDNTFGFGRVNACAALSQTISTLAISGSDQICSSGTYTYSIPGLPAGTTVTWSATGNISVPSNSTGGSVTVAATGSGSGVLTATVASACGNTMVSRTIAVGAPDYTKLLIKNQTPCAGFPVAFGAYYGTQSFCSLNTVNITNVEWQVSSQYQYQVNNNAGTLGCETVNNSGITINFSNVRSPYTAYVKLRVQNACGWSNWSNPFSINVQSCSGGGSFSYYPNPANNELTVNYNETSATPSAVNNETATQYQTADNTGQPTTVSPAANNKTMKSFSAELYNDKGKAIRSGKNGSDGKIVFNTQDIPNGNYFLHIIDGKEVTKKQVIIQH